MILLIDNYDSFVYNLARHFERLGQSTRVVRNDAITIAEIELLAPQAIVISPGPKAPRDAGCSLEVIRRFAPRTPILGVCLGHQAIGEAFGAQITRAPTPVHGRASDIFHAGRSLFAGLPNPVSACRYHSLVIDPQTIPAELEITAHTGDGVIMAVAHRRFPVVGLQFHPESILTEHGYELLAAFLLLANIEPPAALPPRESELAPPTPSAPLPDAPVTF